MSSSTPVSPLADPEVVQDLMDTFAPESLSVWVLRHDIKVDHRPFNFDRHRYLLPIYECTAKEIAVMKAAQLGLTIYLLLWTLHKVDTISPLKVGFYFPTDDAIKKLSKDRLTPMMMENPELKKKIDPATFNNTLGLKQIGDCSIYLMHIGGVASKDSVPMDALLFDEVRLMDSFDIDQTQERVSHSDHKYKLYISTAGFPGQDIHARFLEGTQQYWHSKCLCGPDPEDWCCLPLHWPNCVVDTGDEVYYCCPECGARINSPQNGEYVEHNPGAPYPSFHISQMLSDYIDAEEIWRFWNSTTNIKEFYNAKLGLPFVDEENRPMNKEIFDACVNRAIPWSWTKKELGPIAMGVDQRSGQNHVIIAQRVKDKKRIIHLEIIDSSNPDYMVAKDGTVRRVSPFLRLHELMEEFDVDFCVCDGLPNANEAMAFGRAFKGRVYLAYYHNQRDMVKWSDKAGKKGKGDRSLNQVSREAKFEWHVLLDRYMSIEAALVGWSKRQVELGDPHSMIQKVRNKEGRFRPATIVTTELLPHLMGVIRTKYNVREDGTYAMKWVNTGLDPHLLHAWNYCNMALERVKPAWNYIFMGEEA